MVDVSQKFLTLRTATAQSIVQFPPNIYKAIRENKQQMPKGDIFTSSKIAGIMAAKQTHNLIPLCHSILIDSIDLDLKWNDPDCCIEIESFAKCEGKTGIEMEALMAASIASLTVYDMCKALSKDIIIKEIKLMSKTGGKESIAHNKT